MTPRKIALLLLPYIGVQNLGTDNDLSLLKRGVSESDLEFITLCINGALQEAFDEAPTWVSERPEAAALRPPTSITFDVDEYGKTMSDVTGWQPWMEGCTVRISGDSLDNRLLSETELLRPYMGGSGTVTGMVYCDAIGHGPDVVSVLDPIELPNNARLHVAASAEEFRTYNGLSVFAGYGAQHHPPAYSSAYNLYNKSVGEPCVAFVDTIYDPERAYTKVFLRLNPMPGQPYPISYRVKKQPPQITVADIDTGDHTTDPGTVLPINDVEAALYPFALQRWTAHPLFKAEPEILREIARQYEAAKIKLRSTRPGISRTRAIYAQG